MKICRVFPNFQTDLKYAEHYIAKELSKLGHTTTFITSAKYLNFWKPYLKTTDGLGHKQFDDFDVYRIRSVSPLEKTIFTNWLALYKLLFVKNKFDVLHLSGVGTFSTLIVLLLDKFNNVKKPRIVISDHTDTRSHKRTGFFAIINHFFFRMFFGLLGKRVSAIITFDKIGIDVLSKRYHIAASRFIVIELGYDSELFFYEPALRNRSEKMIIGYAGKIDPKKRVEVLLNAVSKSKCREFVKVVVVGIKENDPYSSMIKKTAAESRFEVELRPFVPTPELAKFCQYINVAVFPGGISITTIEANGCGTPVIIYRSIEGLEVRVGEGRGQLFSKETELVTAIENYYQQFAANNISYDKIAAVTAAAASWKDISKKYLAAYKN